jgi:hypothetical protein
MISDEDLNKLVHIQLQETPTMWLLDMAGTWVMADAEEAAQVKEGNAQYAAKLERARTAKDAFMERASQTIDNARKDKDTQLNGAKMVDSEAQVNESDTFDVVESTLRHYAFRSKTATEIAKEAIDKFHETLHHPQQSVAIETQTDLPAFNNQPEDKVELLRPVVPVKGAGLSVRPLDIGPPITQFISSRLMVSQGVGLRQLRAAPILGPEEEWQKYTSAPTVCLRHFLRLTMYSFRVCKEETLADAFRLVERLICQNVHLESQRLYCQDLMYNPIFSVVFICFWMDRILLIFCFFQPSFCSALMQAPAPLEPTQSGE